jgi:hypothetical protein
MNLLGFAAKWRDPRRMLANVANRRDFISCW